ncbi:GAF domain-containing protein [Chlorogloeopsis sp. ULAP01]|uniref:GAF domain-containing protein n=1 Tax=Chlorogloeopsis sp. ULAP01 TaxID=3056483 RepID=UPI0025AA67D7|nr:GAF domain-containing protein [Chlorogloeopsis sp. ULAP01]MDM9380184.1 GAF domain-containing protein [Chlorogloeopsis sp. ULAP01]
MVIYKFLLSLRRLLFQNKNQYQDNYSKSTTPLSELSEQSRLLHRLNCITLNENESKCMQAHLTTILENRNQEKTCESTSNCIVLEMSEEELRKFASYIGENTSCLFRAIVQCDSNQTQARKLRIISNHGLRLFDVMVKSHNSKELEQEYIYRDSTHLSILLSAELTKLKQFAQINYQHVGINNTVSIDLIFGNLLRVLLEKIRILIDVDTVTVLLPTSDGQQLAVCATIGLEEEILEDIRIPLSCGFAGKIAAEGKYMIVDDLSKIEVVSPILRNKGIRSMLGVPLVLKYQANGVLHVGTFRSRQFTEEDMQQLKIVVEHIGLAIESLLGNRKIISLNADQLGNVCTKYVEVKREKPLEICVVNNTTLIRLIQLFKRLIDANFSQIHICWYRV